MRKPKWQNPVPHPLVGIVWYDHSSNDDWVRPEDVDTALDTGLMYSIGWLIKETDKSYSIASTYNTGDMGFGVLQKMIKGAVVEFKVIAPASKPEKAKKNREAQN